MNSAEKFGKQARECGYRILRGWPTVSGCRLLHHEFTGVSRDALVSAVYLVNSVYSQYF